ncbi:uncharacterized protein LOC113556750 [Rhopalosiphum maidis]|uniref:uncharacterized protein LOC113556750 n=1 Tax=Rhopalosiphum maidis TaxID=43146 RepID=UPI000F00FE63|nr:uncharacterized protein LOC113556750 [Rhopalosiphum maidis]
MMDNQRATSSSAFQPQQIAQPAIETLLFNDIIEEKSLILRDLMDQFLQVHSFSRFESEFNLFTRRIKHIARDGQRNGANLTRHTMQMPSENGAQTENGWSRENNRQHFEPSNAFQRPVAAEHKSKTTLTQNDKLKNIPSTTTNSCDTIIEESIINNCSAQKNTTQSEEFLPPTASIPCSESLQNDNASPTSFNNANADNAMECDSELVESVKIPSNSDNTSTSQLNQSWLNCSEKSKVKYLSKWSVNVKQIKSNKGNSKSFISLSGTLLAADQITVLKKVHKAGILVVRKTKNIVKTEKGFYHLIGPIIEGSPHDLVRACVEINGIPKAWRNILTKLSGEVEVNLNESMTRKGTIYNKEKKASIDSSGTKELLENDIHGLDSDIRQQLSQLSTSTKMKSFECHTPSQLLRNRFHRKFVKACLIIGSQESIDDQ